MWLKVFYALLVVSFFDLCAGHCPFIDVKGCLCTKNLISTNVSCNKEYEGKTLPVYKSNENVYYISINNTKVETIREYEFASWNTSLKILRLENSRISDINSKAFLLSKNNTDSSLPSLELLSLRVNRLTSIATGTFDSLTELMTLYISHNEIRSIDRGLILKLAELSKFSIHHNQLTSLPNRFLTKRLITLRIHVNPLFQLTKENMYGATNLRQISFSTYGTKVAYNAFINRRNLRYIYVEKKLKCSCNLYWYRYTHLSKSLKCNGYKDIKKYLKKYCKYWIIGKSDSSQIFSSFSYVIAISAAISSVIYTRN